ncbi:MAG: trimethylamine methyltransferase family protein [Methanobacteriota archaeon]|nr:MAG: trimethylamine methyltransferase family protein [Euryarchaeota archaeon]
MTIARMSLLSDKDIEKVHEASLRILADGGVKVESGAVRAMLRTAGARVDDTKELVFIDESMVGRSLDSAPGKVKICSRGGNDFIIPSEGNQIVSTDGQPPAVFDVCEGQRRASTLKDLREMMILADALPEVGFIWPTVIATDMPSEKSSYYEFLTAIAYSSKHIQHGAVSADEANFQVEVCSAILGSRENLKERPIFSDVSTPISPLRYDAGEADAIGVLAEAGVPVVHLSMAIAGAVTPASIAGSLAVVNAENLFGMTISQTACEGAPSIYSSFSGVMDLKSGVFLCGTPEGILIDSAAVQMAQHYGLPTCAGGPSNAARSLSSEAGAEGAMTTMAALLIGADMMVGLGGIDRAGMISNEKMVMDCEVWRWLQRLRDGIQIDDTTLGVEAILRQGPGGTFLSDMHTAKHLRKEFMIPQVTAYHTNAEPDRKEDELLTYAKRRVEELLSTHEPPLFDEATASRVGEVAKKYGVLMPDGSQIFEHA